MLLQRGFPVGMGEDCGNRIGEVDERKREQHALDVLVGAADDHRPDERGTERNGDIFADAEHAEAGREAGKFGGDVAKVSEAEHCHRKESHAEAELLTDEVGEAFASDGTHSRGHLLDNNEGEGGRNKGPEQGVAVLGARLGVRQDAAGVVVDIGGDESRSEDREERDQTIGQDAEGRRREAPPKVFRLDVRSHCGCARDYRQRKIASGPRDGAEACRRGSAPGVRPQNYKCLRGDRVGLARGAEMRRLHRFAAVFTQSTAAVSHCGPPFLVICGGADATPFLEYTDARRV